MRYEITVSRKIQTFPYESLGVTLSQEFDDVEVPRDAGFMEVSRVVDEWVAAESRRVGPKSPERVLISPKQPRPRDPMLDLSNEPPDRRRFR